MNDNETLALMKRFSMRHYPLSPIVITHGKGVYVWDENGNVYRDAAAGYSSDNFGHNHPRILKLNRRLNCLDRKGRGPANVVPNVFSNPELARFLARICTMLGYDKGGVTNGGVEANEAAIKLMRKWGYTKKKNRIPIGHAEIVACEGNFHGRTTTVVGLSSDPAHNVYFGPYSGTIVIPYNDPAALEDVLATNRNIAGFIVEAIQGERGVRIPECGYLKACQEICRRHDVALCVDEIQTGLGRAGNLLASWDDAVRPDIVTLGKSLGAGDRPVAAVLAKEEFAVFEPGEHGSTYGGNIRSMAIANEALSIIEDEKLCDRSLELGTFLLFDLKRRLSAEKFAPLVKEVRGRGLMIGIELKEKVVAKDILSALLAHGVLTKDAHGVIRITPPLVITEKECIELASRIEQTFIDLTA